MRLRVTLVILGIFGEVSVAQESKNQHPDRTNSLSADQRIRIVQSIKEIVNKRSEAPQFKEAVRELEVELDAAKNGKVDSRVKGVVVRANGTKISYQSQKVKDEYVNGIEKRIAAMKESARKPIDDPVMYAPLLPMETKVGAFGKFLGKVRIDHVVDKTTAVVTNYRVETTGYGERNQPAERAEAVPLVYCISGLDTSTMADGALVDMPGVFAVVGNRRVGIRTLFNLVQVQFDRKDVDLINGLAPGTGKWPAGEAKSAEENGDDRTYWKYLPEFGDGYFKLVSKGKWEEIGRDGKLLAKWEEVGRTPDYVELYDSSRNYKMRLGAGEAWLTTGSSVANAPTPTGVA